MQRSCGKEEPGVAGELWEEGQYRLMHQMPSSFLSLP